MASRELPQALRKQIDYLYTLDFYRRKMEGSGLGPRDIRSLEDFQRLPFTTRQEFVKEMERADPPYGFFFTGCG